MTLNYGKYGIFLIMGHAGFFIMNRTSATIRAPAVAVASSLGMLVLYGSTHDTHSQTTTPRHVRGFVLNMFNTRAHDDFQTRVVFTGTQVGEHRC